MFNNSINMLLLSTLIAGFTSCGGGDSNNKKDTRTTGYFIDSPVKGLNYECGDIKGITDSKGAFSCDNAPVTFKLGKMQIGVLKSFTKDNKMYPQDLLGLRRDNFTDEKLIKLIRLLQSIDDDEDISKNINITKDVSDSYTENLNLDKSMLAILVAPSNGNLISEEDAIRHLQNSMGADAHLQAPKDSTSDDAESTSNAILDDVVNNLAENNNSNSSSNPIGDINSLTGSEDGDVDTNSLANGSNNVDTDALADEGSKSDMNADTLANESGNSDNDMDSDSLANGSGNNNIDANSIVDENSKNGVDANSIVDENSKNDVDADSMVDENNKNDIDTDSIVDDSSDSATNKKKIGTGHYVDSAVKGVQYECGDQSGITDVNGTFTFEEGKECIFKLEGILLRNVKAVDLKDNMTLLEDNIDNARLLQSLDNDGDADNGIEISKNILDGLIASDLTAVPVGDTEIKAFFKELGVTDIAGFDGDIVTLDETKQHLTDTKNEIERLQEIVDNNNVSEEETESMVDNIDNDLDLSLN